MRHKNRLWHGALLAALAALLLGGGALAAEVSNGDVYRLAANQVVEDDLVVTAREIYIDGTVKGDLVAMGSVVQVNGTVEGDAMIAAADVQIAGTVADDARVAGAGVTISGHIGDDLFMAAGGSQTVGYPLTISGRSIEQGARIADSASIGGSVYLGAGTARVAGTITEDLKAGAGALALAGTVKRNADISSSALNISPDAHINGRLSYTATQETAVPPGAAGDVRFVPQPPAQSQADRGLGGQLLRFVLVLLGFAAVSWLLLRFAPSSVRRPAAALAARPTQAGLYGLAAIALLFIVPIASGLVMIALIALWGWLPGLMFFLFLTAALVLAWTLSPLITGLWLGRLVLRAAGRETSDLVAILAGTALIALLSFVPFVGWLFSLTSLILAVGGVLLIRRGDTDTPAPAATPAATLA
jgi:cytoskeletal protein CcmA (bactofilin family)